MKSGRMCNKLIMYTAAVCTMFETQFKNGQPPRDLLAIYDYTRIGFITVLCHE